MINKFNLLNIYKCNLLILFLTHGFYLCYNNHNSTTYCIGPFKSSFEANKYRINSNNNNIEDSIILSANILMPKFLIKKQLSYKLTPHIKLIHNNLNNKISSDINNY